VTRVVGVLLAAGRATRFGSDKLLAPLPRDAGDLDSGTPVALAACRHLVSALSHTIAVVRSDAAALERHLASTGARVVRCANADDGMSASLVCGVAAALDADAWVIALADMPWISPQTIAAVAEAVSAGATIVAPFHEGTRGHPVAFARSLREELLALRGDQGAREILRAHEREIMRIDVVDPGILRDVDVPSDL